MKKILIVILLLISLVLAQEPQVKLNHFGYGKTPQEVKFTIHCLGEIPISNMTVYVDGKEYKNIYAYLTPKTGIELSAYLEPGKHLVEVNSSEGAYDSLELAISDSQENQNTPEKQDLSSTKTIPLKVVVVFLAISVIAFFLLAKKSKLK